MDQLGALIRLLCTEDDRTNLGIIEQRLIELGNPCIAALRTFQAQGDSRARSRIEGVIEEITWRELAEAFAQWARSPGSVDLESGVFLLARFGHPMVDIPGYRAVLDHMGEAVQGRLRSLGRAGAGSLDRLEVLREYLFDRLGFRGNRVDYYEPDNSYLNRVIDRHCGIPISLSVIVLLVGGRAGLPLEGIGLPGHFVVRYRTPEQEVYLDAFNQGRFLSRSDCIEFLENTGYGVRPEFFEPSTPVQIVIRMVRNLVYIYDRLGQTRRVQWLNRLIQCLV